MLLSGDSHFMPSVYGLASVLIRVLADSFYVMLL